MDRKTFIRKTSVGLLIAVPAYSLLGCGSDDNGGPGTDPTPTANCLQNGTIDNIATNHTPPHLLTVSADDVEDGNEKTYQLSAGGSDNHTHSLTITAAQFTTLKSNSSISAVSTSDSGHTHNVTVSCATA